MQFIKDYWFPFLLVVIIGIAAPYVLLAIVVLLAYLFLFGDFSTIDDLNHPKTNKLETSDLIHFMYIKNKYLKSDEWAHKRNLTLQRDNYSCRKCGSPNRLAIHHLSGYNLLPKEPISCLVTLCSKCHQKQHDKFGYPQTFQEYMNWSVYLA